MWEIMYLWVCLVTIPQRVLQSYRLREKHLKWERTPLSFRTLWVPPCTKYSPVKNQKKKNIEDANISSQDRLWVNYMPVEICFSVRELSPRHRAECVPSVLYPYFPHHLHSLLPNTKILHCAQPTAPDNTEGRLLLFVHMVSSNQTN